MPLLRRLHEGSSPQAPLHSEWMGDKPGVSEGMASSLVPRCHCFLTQTRCRAAARRGTQRKLTGGYILNSEWVKMSLCSSIFISFQWRPYHLFLHLLSSGMMPLTRSPAASSWDLKIKLSLSSFSSCCQPPGFHRKNLAHDCVGDTWSHTDSHVALPDLDELCEIDMSRYLFSPGLPARRLGECWVQSNQISN